MCLSPLLLLKTEYKYDNHMKCHRTYYDKIQEN